MRQKELETADWQRNLKIAWIGTFFTGASFSIVMPFMALYVEELGVKGAMVEWYAGLSVALSALASALVSPVWGHLADRYGRILCLLVRERRAYARGVLFSCRRRDVLMCDKRERKH